MYTIYSDTKSGKIKLLERIDYLKRNRFIRSSVNLAGRVIGIVNTLVIMKFLGTGRDVDNFVVAYALYNYLFNTISPIVEAQTTANLNLDKLSANRIYKSIWIFTKFISFPIVAVSVFLYLKFSIFYALLCIPVITSNYIAYYFGYATHKEQWHIIFLSNLIRLIISAGIIILSYKTFGIYSAIGGIIIGDFAKYIYLRSKYSGLVLNSRTTDKDFNKQVAKQVPSHVLNGLTPVINRYVAFYLGIPQIIFIDLAEKLYSGVTLTFAHVFIPPKFNDWSAFYLKDRKQASKKILKTSYLVGFIFIIISILLFLVVRSIKVFSGIALLNPTMYYFLGLGPYLSTLILVKLMILEKKTQVLSFISILQIILNVIGSLLLTPRFGLSGIAISVTIASTITTLVLWIYSLKVCK